MTARPAPPEWVVVGRIVAPQGIRGDVRVAPDTDRPAERFAPGSRLHLGPRVGEELVPAQVLSSRPLRTLWVVGLDALRDRSAAEAARGWFLQVPVAGLPPQPEGTYYHHQLLGLEVRTVTGERLGELAGILRGGSHDNFVVRDPRDGRERLVPALRRVVRRVDLEGGWIEIDPLPGLFD